MEGTRKWGYLGKHGRVLILMGGGSLVLMMFRLVPADVECTPSPLEFSQPLQFTAPYGQVRSTHFHAGWDLSTRAREGDVVRAVRSGKIIRLRVKPTGYGRAVFVQHADGSIAVYAHLLRFSDRIEERVRAWQRLHRSQDVEWWLEESEQFPVQAGEILGFSGSTGTVTGPHLHLEIRDGSHRPVPPQRFLGKICQYWDQMPPRITDVGLVCIRAVPVPGGDTLWWYENRLAGRVKISSHSSSSHIYTLTAPCASGMAGVVFRGVDVQPSERRGSITQWQVTDGGKGDTLFLWKPAHFRYDTFMRISPALRWAGTRWLTGFWLSATSLKGEGYWLDRQQSILKAGRERVLVVEACDQAGNCRKIRVRVQIEKQASAGEEAIAKETVKWMQWVAGKAVQDTLCVEGGQICLRRKGSRVWWHAVEGGVRVSRNCNSPHGFPCVYVDLPGWVRFLHPVEVRMAPEAKDWDVKEGIRKHLVVLRLSRASQWNFVAIPVWKQEKGWIWQIRRGGTYTIAVDTIAPVLIFRKSQEIPDTIKLQGVDRLDFGWMDQWGMRPTADVYINGEWYPSEMTGMYQERLRIWLVPDLLPQKAYKMVVVLKDRVGNQRAYQMVVLYE